jgi:hypothetical protein
MATTTFMTSVPGVLSVPDPPTHAAKASRQVASACGSVLPVAGVVDGDEQAETKIPTTRPTEASRFTALVFSRRFLETQSVSVNVTRHLAVCRPAA